MTKVDEQNLKIHKDVAKGMMEHGDSLAKAEAIANKAPLTDKYKENYDKINWKKDKKAGDGT